MVKKFLSVTFIVLAVLYAIAFGLRGWDMFNGNFTWFAPVLSVAVGLIVAAVGYFRGNSVPGWKIVLWTLGGVMAIGVILMLLDRAVDFHKSDRPNFYIVAYLVLVVVIIIVCVKIRKWQINRDVQRQLSAMSSVHGTAQWSTEAEFIADHNPSNKADGLWIGGGYFRNVEGHQLTVAGSREGKGVSQIIPSLLVAPYGSNFVVDVKGENAKITARAQKSYDQKVLIVDPWGLQETIGATHGIPSSGFNPFDFLAEDDDLPDNCQVISQFLIPDNKAAKEPYWQQKGRNIIKMYLLHIVTYFPKEEHNFWTLYLMLRADDDRLNQILADMKKNDAYDSIISAFANEIATLRKADTTYAGVMSEAHNGTAIFESPKLRKSLAKSDYNPADLKNGDMTIYVCIPEKYLESHSAWLRIIITMTLKACNTKKGKRVNFFIDEMGLIGKIDEIPRAYQFGAGQGLSLWGFVQDLGQLEHLYGKSTLNTILGTGAIMAFGINDQHTREYISNLLGDSTVLSDSLSPGGTSTSSVKRPLLTPEEVGKEKGIIVITSKTKFVVMRKPYWKSIFDMGIPKKKNDRDEWKELFDELADPPPSI